MYVAYSGLTPVVYSFDKTKSIWKMLCAMTLKMLILRLNFSENGLLNIKLD